MLKQARPAEDGQPRGKGYAELERRAANVYLPERTIIKGRVGQWIFR
jgi:hypothetical protein